MQTEQTTEGATRGHEREAAPTAPVGYRPMADRILLRPDLPPEKIGLILLAQATQHALKAQIDRGTVLAIGPGMLTKDGERWPMPDIQVGDTLVYYLEGGVQVKLSEGVFLSIRDDFALATIRDGQLVPLGTRVCVKRDKADDRVGSLILPGTAQKKPLEGKIIAVGSGKALMGGKRRMPRTEVGMVVLFREGFGTSVKVDGEEFLLLSEDDLEAVRDPEVSP
jgi:chaperonin GroES